MLSDRLMALIRNPETPHYAIRDAVMEEDRPVPSVYVVTGTTGNHSDHVTWLVAGYLDRSQAEAVCLALNHWCRENSVWDDEHGPCASRVRTEPVCPLDSRFRYDPLTGTRYEVEEIPLKVEE